MITIYGIKNCDTMKKAFTWLDKNRIDYTFHDYKKEGIDAASIQHWLKKLPLEKLINSKGPTYRKLSDEDKSLAQNSKTAIPLMMNTTSMIKRPLVALGKEEYLLGFDEEIWKKALKK